ncbi:hypothetical protein [Haloarchaeobius amylolyticus]|uniref:hypothetical protein n=1 Tax=Haloarchaeobius amylolyticus TaxID=1198296 RepID=UPI002270AE6C|nr:hypothetical protein [Haloarchaeobius amylolyticus]
MRRRAFLASLGTAVATAGCLAGGDSPGTDDRTPTTGTDPTTTPPGTDRPPAPFTDTLTVGDTTLRFAGPVVQHSYFRLTTPDSMAVEVADGQFCFVGVAVEDGSPPDPDAFALVVGEETYDLGTELGERVPYSVPVAAGDGRPYRTDEGAGWVAADVPAPIDEAEPLLRVSVGEETHDVTLPGHAADTLGDPAPAFTFGEVSAPESVAADEPIPVEVPVTNEGDGPGTARVVVNETGPMYAPHQLETALDPGASETLTGSIDTHMNAGDGTGTVSFTVLAPGLESSHSVTITGSA